MNNCCDNYIGEFPHNESIDTGLTAGAAGVYVFEFSAMNFTKFKWKKNFAAGEKLVIDQCVLCEDFFYEFTITKPDGTKITQNNCEAFSLKTYISTNNFCNGYFCNC